MTTFSSEYYDGNLAALRASQPALADVVDASIVPDTVTPAKARDASPSFLITDRDDRQRWFGGSSMPKVSAPEVFAEFRSDGRNVALPGVLTGFEPLVLLPRMPRHTALFVVEADPVNLKLAMLLHDYAQALSSGRLVFMLGEAGTLPQAMRTFFDHHPGFELPTHLLKVPQRTADEIAALQHSLETASVEVMAAQTRSVEAQVRAIAAATRSADSHPPSVAVLGVDPGQLSIEYAARVRRALSDLGWRHSVCVPDAPNRCSLSQRLQAVIDIEADMILIINGTLGAMRPLLPSDLPVACWFLADANILPIEATELHKREVLYASTQAIRDALLRAGAPNNRIANAAPAADHIAYSTESPAPPQGDGAAPEVVVLMDLPDDRPESCNVHLASHVSLWHALQEVVTRSADRYRSRIADEFLADAERLSGTTLQDPKIRDYFLDLLKVHIAPPTLARTTVDALVQAGISVTVWGANWNRHSKSATNPHPRMNLRGGPIPTGAELCAVFRSARMVLLPSVTPFTVQTALDGLAAGARVLCRRPEEPFEHLYPGLENVIPHLNLFETSRQLIDLVKKQKDWPHANSTHALAAQTVILRDHTASRRLASMVERLRNQSSLPSAMK